MSSFSRPVHPTRAVELRRRGRPIGALLAALTVCVAALAPATQKATACTSILVTPGASADGSTIISYAADAHVLYGSLEVSPARRHPPGAVRKIFEWDTGKYLGSIPQVRQTYHRVGHINEHQLVIGETTFTGRKSLKGSGGILDYGSLMFIALERARTAREAIAVITELVAAHGYASTGESFSLGDPHEAWILEMIGKGPGEKGAVWVACRVPDGQISAHANKARIRRFPLDDPERCIYSADVISFARSKGFFSGKDGDFSFADAYHPTGYLKQRFGEARVWSVFRRAAPSQKLELDLTAKPKLRPLPLTITPDKKLSVREVMALMRDHFDGTALDMTKDVGAGPYRLPYRWRPLTWTVDGVQHFHERAISTQQTGFSFVSQSRRWFPNDIGGVLWFGVDDTASTVYVPVSAGVTRAPRPFSADTASFTRFSWDSAFWVFNFVANLAYLRYADAIGDIRQAQVAIENDFAAHQERLEQDAARLHRRSPAAARRLLTRSAVTLSDQMMSRWRLLGEQLLMKYLDGNVRDASGEVTHPGYPASWYRRIIRDTGARYRVRKLPGEPRDE